MIITEKYENWKLYHSCDETCLLYIIKNDAIVAGKNASPKGISVSRDPKFFWLYREYNGGHDMPFIIELDAHKLSENHKIEPYQDQRSHPPLNIPYDRAHNKNEAEECIAFDKGTKQVSNIGKFITSIKYTPFITNRNEHGELKKFNKHFTFRDFDDMTTKSKKSYITVYKALKNYLEKYPQIKLNFNIEMFKDGISQNINPNDYRLSSDKNKGKIFESSFFNY